MPSSIFLIWFFVRIIKYGLPKYNKDALKYGSCFFIIAIICFIKGTDDENDYLRIFHGLWHCFISISFFYIFQMRKP